MKKYIISFIKENKKALVILLLCDLLIIVLHLLFGKNQTFFNLDHERNLPTVYQSLKLIIFGLYFILNLKKQKLSKKILVYILPISIFFVVLGFDELLEIHENIYQVFEFLGWFRPETVVDVSLELGYRSSLWIIYYLPIIFIYFFWSGYWFHYFQNNTKNTAWTIAGTSFLLLTIMLTELLGSSGMFSDDIYFKLITVEEIAELLFATLLIAGTLELFQSTTNKISKKN